MLASEPQTSDFENPRTGLRTRPTAATIHAIGEAFKAWKADGDTNEENLLIFYFCGHGLASGLLTALLAEDFGRDSDNALDGALDFHRNRLGMSCCKAREQLYLVDACRSDAEMTRYAADYAGRVFVQPKAVTASIRRPVLYSTLWGQPAHGRAGKPSYFAQAALDALDGAGADRTKGNWRVRTSSLHLAIEAQLGRRMRSGAASAQIAAAEDLAAFDLHHIEGAPLVPVVVSCDPSETLAGAKLRCVYGGAVVNERTQPAPIPWELALKVGSYDFEASFDAGPARAPAEGGQPEGGRSLVNLRDEYVYPPELNVTLQVVP